MKFEKKIQGEMKNQMIKYWEPVDEVDQRKKLNQSGKWSQDSTVGIPAFRGQTGEAETAKETEQELPRRQKNQRRWYFRKERGNVAS